jgi:hypothetical protein
VADGALRELFRGNILKVCNWRGSLNIRSETCSEKGSGVSRDHGCSRLIEDGIAGAYIHLESRREVQL